jgi:ribosome maturation factor RimP
VSSGGWPSGCRAQWETTTAAGIDNSSGNRQEQEVSGVQAGHIRSLVEGPLARVGLVVEDVTVAAAGRRSVVRIAVDRSLDSIDPQDTTSSVAPLSLDDVADATRIVDAALDAAESLGNAPYVLEVSSPGVDRPLTERRHLRRNVGRLARLRLRDGSERAGRILSVGDAVVTIAADPVTGPAPDLTDVALDELREGRVVIEFGRIDEADLDEGFEEED